MIMGDHHRPSPISGLKPFLLVGLVVVIGLLVGLNFLLKKESHGLDALMVESEGSIDENVVPGSFNIGPDPGAKMDADPTPVSELTGPATEAVTPSEFTFYETLKKSSDEPAGTVDLIPKERPSERVANQKSSPVPRAQKPSPLPTRSRMIETTAVSDGSLLYTVQVASFREKAMAEGVVEQLTKKGHEAYLMATKLPDGMTYRVRVGRYEAREKATTVAKKLAAEENFHPFIARLQP